MIVEFFREWALPTLVYSNKTVFPLMAGAMLLMGCGWRIWRNLLVILVIALGATFILPSAAQMLPQSRTLVTWYLNIAVLAMYNVLTFKPIAEELEEAESR